MRNTAIVCCSLFLLSACSTYSPPQHNMTTAKAAKPEPDFAARLPTSITPPGEKVVVIDPHVHAWGAYSADGSLVRGGLATSGSDWCPDLHRRCHTQSGSFRVESLGAATCKSSIFPIPRGGAPMPYCMFFNRNQAMHGSYELGDANLSHGCVRMHVSDAEWLRFNFVNVGTKVVVKPY